jgi:hypothetical protein
MDMRLSRTKLTIRLSSQFSFERFSAPIKALIDGAEPRSVPNGGWRLLARQ